LVDAYSPDTVIFSSPRKKVHDSSLGLALVPVWMIILSDQLLIISLASYPFGLNLVIKIEQFILNRTIDVGFRDNQIRTDDFHHVKVIERISTTHQSTKAAIRGVTPNIRVKARRVSESTHQVPIEIGLTQGKALAIRWLLAASRKRPGRNMAFKLGSELVDAAKGSGDAIHKKEETRRMVEANRILTHFR
ncbi:hypothetical protein RYX36_018244, partial [Vicia faba]